MFFNNKNENEETVEEVKKEDFIISDYAMERYKKSEHYNKYDLINEEIELLFCDKKEWDDSLTVEQENLFSQGLNKLAGHFSHIVFPHFSIENINYKNNMHFYFEYCIFYNYSLFREYKEASYKFINCTFLKSEKCKKGSTVEIETEEKVYIYKSKTDSVFYITNCSDLSINKCNGDVLLYQFTIDKIHINDTTLNNDLSLKNMNIKELYIRNCVGKGDFNFHGINRIEDCNFGSIKFNSLNAYSSKIINCHISASEIGRIELNGQFVENSICNISGSTINHLEIYSIDKITLEVNNFEYIKFIGINEYLSIQSSTSTSCNFNNLENKNICILDKFEVKKIADFKFASINKLAIYKSNFKELDFDCSFINEARFSQVKGLSEANEIEELSDKHFSSKESFKFFEKVTK